MHDDPLAWRDPEYIRRQIDWFGRYVDRWFDPELSGLEHVPASGRVLAVGMHNGGTMSPDMCITMVAFWRRFGFDRLAYGLAHDLVFRVPGVGRWLRRLGGLPARQENGMRALARGAAVLVYPGGDVDSFKPAAERHVVKFGGRTGFIRLALRARAPIVPIVSVGAHQIFHVITDGRDVALRLGLKRGLRMEVMPVMLAAPWGLTFGPFLPYLPMPSRVRVRALPAIDLGLAPDAADDRDAVAAAAERVRGIMQAGVEALVAEGEFGPREWVRRRLAGSG